MADTIAIMNHGVIEQLGAPQEIYDRPATHVRRRLHRLAGDELPAPSTARSTRGDDAVRDRRRRDRRAGAARGRRRRRRWCSACGPSMSASTTTRALRGEVLRRRVSRHHARSSPSTPRTARRCKARARRRRAGRSAASTVGLAFDADAAVAVRRGERAGAAARRLHDGGCAMAEVALERRHQALRRRSTRSTTSTSTSPTASSSCCSGRPAPARPRRCAWSPASSSPTRARSRSAARDVTGRAAGGARRRLRVPAVLALSAPDASTTTWPSRCARRCAATPEAEIRARGAARSRELLRIDDKLQQPGDAAVRRRDAARRDRPRAGAPARGLPDGRAAVLARRQAARRPAPRAQAHPAGARRHHALRHPRPDRGDDHGRPHRRARRRAGWCRSARRARSTSDPAASMSRRRLGSPPINLLPRGAAAGAGAPAGARDGRRAHRASRASTPANGAATGAGRAGRASRRPEPSCMLQVGRPTHRADAWPTRIAARGRRRASRSSSSSPLFFDADGRRIAAEEHEHVDATRPAAPDRRRRRSAIIDHADELTALDQAIGDGDHGLNMKRGFEAVLAELRRARRPSRSARRCKASA